MKKTLVAATIIVVVMAACCAQNFSATANSDEVKHRSNPVQIVVQQDDDGDRSRFMRKKLTMVQQVVEGIATEDFDMIRKGGMELAALAESAAFKSAGDPYYKHYSANFEHAVKGLVSAAQSQSVEKATFAYVHVTISCTACHQHVRGTVRTAQ